MFLISQIFTAIKLEQRNNNNKEIHKKKNFSQPKHRELKKNEEKSINVDKVFNQLSGFRHKVHLN